MEKETEKKILEENKELFDALEEYDKEEYHLEDPSWPSRKWNKDKTDYIDLSGDPRDLTGREVISRPVEVQEIPNNCFCKERCCLCTYIFDADSTTIYRLTGVGLICYDCAGKLKFLDGKEVDKGIPMSYDEAVKRSLK